jgi:uncharacterized protein (TIGR03437 family)
MIRPFLPGLLLALGILPAQAQILNKNLILNGDAEAGAAAAAPGAAAVSLPNWTTSGGFSVGAYGRDGFLAIGDYGPVNRGQQLFYGGPGATASSAVQVVDLTGASSQIDAGQVKYQLSGYLGLLGGSYDNVTAVNLTADFQDASGTTLLHAVANGPSVADIECCLPEGLMLRTAAGFLPPNVRKAKVTINLAIGGGGTLGNNYAADNIALLLTADPMFGANLLVNGDGETDPGGDEAPVPGWSSPSKFVAWKWGDDKMPKTTDPGPPNRGKYFFNCYVSRALCQAYQTVDFSVANKLVDAGKVNYSLSGWLGGAVDWLDNADVKATFFDANGKPVGAGATIGPVTNSDRNGQAGLLQRSTSGLVPNGARAVQVTISFHKLGPVTDNLYAYADSLVFTLNVMQVTAVVNAASWLSGPVAGGEFVTLAGSGLGPAAGASGMQKGLGGSRVFFNGIEAFLTYASDGQVNAIVPYAVGARADVTVQYNGKTSDVFPLTVADSSPGIFTSQYGAGPAVAVNDGISFNSAANPVARNGMISFWATGQGAVSPAGQDGESITGWKDLTLSRKVTVGGVDAQVQFIGLIYTGEIQVNAIVPANAPTGDAEVVLTIGNAASRKGVTISVK